MGLSLPAQGLGIFQQDLTPSRAPRWLATAKGPRTIRPARGCKSLSQAGASKPAKDLPPCNTSRSCQLQKYPLIALPSRIQAEIHESILEDALMDNGDGPGSSAMSWGRDAQQSPRPRFSFGITPFSHGSQCLSLLQHTQPTRRAYLRSDASICSTLKHLHRELKIIEGMLSHAGTGKVMNRARSLLQINTGFI